MAETKSSVVREYEERQKKILDIEKSKEEREAELASLSAKLAKTKAEWLGPLTDLVERISTNFSGFFSSMSCAGQVSLDQGADEVKPAVNSVRFIIAILKE